MGGAVVEVGETDQTSIVKEMEVRGTDQQNSVI